MKLHKLLVNAPSGAQEIVKVEMSGGYFDKARVIWDERIDGPIPTITEGAMVRSGDTLIVDSDKLALGLAGRKRRVADRKIERIERRALARLIAAETSGEIAALESLVSDPTKTVQDIKDA